MERKKEARRRHYRRHKIFRAEREYWGDKKEERSRTISSDSVGKKTLKIKMPSGIERRIVRERSIKELLKPTKNKNLRTQSKARA